MELTEKRISRKNIYECPVFKVFEDKVELPNGNISTRNIINHRGGVCIAALKENGNILLVKQFRYVYNEVILEFPAGKKELNEDSIETAKRELMEETGYKANTLLFLGSYYPTCGYTNEIIDLYFAKDLEYVGQHLDEDEFLNVTEMNLEKIIELCNNGTIVDGKTMALAYKVKELLK